MSDNQEPQNERNNLGIHIDFCAFRYGALEDRIERVEGTLTEIHTDIKAGQHSLTKVLVGTAGTIVAGLLSTIVVILIESPI